MGDDGEMTEEQRVRFAGGLMAAATHILVSHAQESWTPGWERRFPFRMGLAPAATRQTTRRQEEAHDNKRFPR